MSIENLEDLMRDGVVDMKPASLRPYGLSRSQAYNLMNAGKLTYTRVRGRRLIPIRALRQLLAAGVVPASN